MKKPHPENWAQETNLKNILENWMLAAEAYADGVPFPDWLCFYRHSGDRNSMKNRTWRETRDSQ